MRSSRTQQPVTYDVRLPDEAQDDALRLLDASRAVVNEALTLLWPSLDDFGSERVGPAWKQVGKYTGSPQYHGDRQWRCESETVGRILRARAERKKVFDLIHPILSDGLIRPKTESRPAGKKRASIKEAITALQTSLDTDVLLLLARVHDCSLLSMESLKTLKTTGRGKDVRGRWRNYRNNATIRGEIWRLLRYKCHLIGLRFHTEQPRGTSHTCPQCGKPAKTYRSPSDRSEAVNWGRWLWCEACGFNGDRDYCASLNIARLGVAYLLQMKTLGKARACSITDPRVKPVSYTGAGAVLLLPPPGTSPARNARGKICYCPGWLGSAFLQSSQPKAVFLRLCG